MPGQAATPDNLIDTSDLYASADRGEIAPSAVRGVLDRLAGEQTRWALAFGHIQPAQVDDYRRNLLKHLRKHQKPLETKAYRRSVSVMAPVEPIDWGVTGAAAVGMPLAIARLKNKPMTLGQAAASAVGPKAVPYTAVAELVSILGINPMRDPQYRRGTRGYFKSVGEGLAGQAEDFGRKSEELRNRYGALGLPLQALHGVLNPISGVTYAGKSFKDLLMGKQGALLAKSAEAQVVASLKGV
jgi:hypothetical protein